MIRRKIKLFLFFSAVFISAIALFCVFFDEAVLVRKGTVYRNHIEDKVVALTFDDGPSPLWTPKILDELRRLDIKATFFMIGEQVEKYPEVARRVAAEGHEIENHSYDHHVLIYYKMPELEAEVKDAEKAIWDITGRRTHYFRPPKSWLRHKEKIKIKQMGYEVVLWSLNSKDWVNFPAWYIVRYILRRMRPG
ncbi:MAG: polysaccharide deacetylase family protein, partial [Candidatus Omnitrophota bacterium]